MESLSIKHNTHILLRKILGIITIICGIIYIILAFTEPKPMHLILAFFWIVIGMLYYVSSLESNRSIVEPFDGYIRIRWMNWFKAREIRDVEIERIMLSKPGVKIDIKGKKQISLPLDFFELSQKKEVYTYFIELCRQRNLVIEKSL